MWCAVAAGAPVYNDIHKRTEKFNLTDFVILIRLKKLLKLRVMLKIMTQMCDKVVEKLKADRPHPRDYPPMPPDYRHTDQTLGLVTTTLYSECEGNGRTDATNYIISLAPRSIIKSIFLDIES